MFTPNLLSSSHRRALLLATSALACAPAAMAQYRTERSDAVGVQFKVHTKLHPVPLKLGSTIEAYKMRFEPKDDSDLIRGQFPWSIALLQFPKKAKEANDGPTTGAETEAEEPEAEDDEEGIPLPGSKRKDPNVFDDFADWTRRDPNQQKRLFYEKGKKLKGRGKTPNHVYWEFLDHTNSNWPVWVCAAVYDLPDQEVVLMARIPCVAKDDTEAKPKWAKIGQNMIRSLQLMKGGGGGTLDDDAERDKFADTDWKKKALVAAKNNINNLKGWDYFTTPNYIILYSWDPEKKIEQRKKMKFAKKLADLTEGIRVKYEELYPPHEDMEELYSVLRICTDHDEFMSYSTNTSPGVVGWFSPATKELVVFAGDSDYFMFKEEDVISTTFHEGWHQYANRYFKGAELHRWIGEGTGDFFGGFRPRGRNKWVYSQDEGRGRSIKGQVKRGAHVANREIINWNKDKFYGAGAANFYAQGYALVDFLRNGSKLGKRLYDPKWNEILDTYREVMLDTEDQKKAVEAAFKGVDWDKFDLAWEYWVGKMDS